MPWISSPGAITEEETQNNADICIGLLSAYDNNAVAALLANWELESGINPGREEVGGSGYGLIQWTPIDTLITHAQVLGLSPYTNGGVQVQVAIAEITGKPASVNEWYTSEGFIINYYNSGATPDMIGVTGEQFLKNEMQWSTDKLAVLYMAARERPSYDPATNHYQQRMESAIKWLEYMGGVVPPHGKPIPGWNVDALIQYGAIAESIRKRRYFK